VLVKNSVNIGFTNGWISSAGKACHGKNSCLLLKMSSNLQALLCIAHIKIKGKSTLQQTVGCLVRQQAENNNGT
jgi:hypothetical protein